MVSGFNYKSHKQDSFCKSCIQGKLHRSPFPSEGTRRAEKPLDLVHTDVCGKINTKSLGGAEYLLTFIDNIFGCIFSKPRMKSLSTLCTG